MVQRFERLELPHVRREVVSASSAAAVRAVLRQRQRRSAEEAILVLTTRCRRRARRRRMVGEVLAHAAEGTRTRRSSSASVPAASVEGVLRSAAVAELLRLRDEERFVRLLLLLLMLVRGLLTVLVVYSVLGLPEEGRTTGVGRGAAEMGRGEGRGRRRGVAAVAAVLVLKILQLLVLLVLLVLVVLVGRKRSGVDLRGGKTSAKGSTKSRKETTHLDLNLDLRVVRVMALRLRSVVLRVELMGGVDVDWLSMIRVRTTETLRVDEDVLLTRMLLLHEDGSVLMLREVRLGNRLGMGVKKRRSLRRMRELLWLLLLRKWRDVRSVLGLLRRSALLR